MREAFFVSFLGKLGVAADAAFACGFLFFVMTLVLALPGLADHLLGECAAARRRCPMARADVSVVVVTWNALPWLEQCLESVRGHETIVVDHGSTDGTLELVRERFPEVRVIEQANVGMGGGNNAGMRVAGGRYWFFLLNSDAWVLGDGLDAAGRVRRRASGRGGRRAEAAQPRRHAAALGARRADALAARDRVPRHPQARARARGG